METYQEIIKKELADYISDETSCAAQLTKAWLQGGLTESESMIFCRKFMKKNKPGKKWGSEKKYIDGHRNWLFSHKWVYTEKSPKGKIMIQTNW
jgi:hypothetical protein